MTDNLQLNSEAIKHFLSIEVCKKLVEEILDVAESFVGMAIID